MIGPGYWATGITVRHFGGQWSATVEFRDHGFLDDAATEGTLRTRYSVDDLGAVIDTIKGDAERLGIRWNTDVPDCPALYVEGDGETDPPPPEGWRDLLALEATRIGWSTYRTTPTDDYQKGPTR